MNDWLSARHLLAVRLDNSGDVVMLEQASGMGGSK